MEMTQAMARADADTEAVLMAARACNEHAVRAAAGITLAPAIIAFVQAYFAHVYWPIQTVTVFFFVEFLVRTRWGLPRSPVGRVAQRLVAHRAPHWVPARPKRFAWQLGLGMSFAMAIITNVGIRGALPLSICLLCISLMWLEAALGWCMGCEMHGWFVRRGWLVADPGFDDCRHGVCGAPIAPRTVDAAPASIDPGASA